MFHLFYRSRYLLALVLFALCVPLALSARHLSVDPTNHAFIIRSDEHYRTYQDFLSQFGSDETIVVGVECHPVLTPDIARWLGELVGALTRVAGVEESHSLATSRVLEKKLLVQLVEKPILQDFIEGQEDLSVLQRKVRYGPPEASKLISSDGSLLSIVLNIAPEERRSVSRHQIVEEVRDVLTNHERSDISFRLTGTVVEQDSFVSLVERDRKLFVPISVVVIVALLLLFQTNLATLLYSVAVMGATLWATEGCMVLNGTPLNAVTSLLAPVILIVAVSSTVMVSKSLRPHGEISSREQDLRTSYREVFLPCLLSNLTTAIGFLSLLASQIPALREFGVYGAIGTGIGWVLTMAWAPVFGPLVSRRISSRHLVFEKIGQGLWTLACRACWLTLLATTVFLLFSVSKLSGVDTSTDLLKIFRENDTFRLDTVAMQRKLGGVYPVEIVLIPPARDSVNKAATWDALDRFEERLTKLSHVSYALSLADVVAYIESKVGLKRSDAMIEKIVGSLPEKMGKDHAHFVSQKSGDLRMTLFLDSSDTQRTKALADKIEGIARQCLPEGWRAKVTGQTVLLAVMSQHLVEGESASVGLAFGVILIAAILLFRSVGYALLSVAPNVVPVAGLFAAMACADIPLNTATATIASVAIGLVFNNTVYLIHHYRRWRREGQEAITALRCALRECAQPMVASSCILAGGFSVTMFGHMTPTIQFGMLSTLTIAIAVIADMIFLPALLAVLRPR